MVIAAFWWNSSMRATISRQAAEPAAAAVAPTGVPAALTQRWTATSARTLSPIVVSNTVVTGDERTVAATVLDADVDNEIGLLYQDPVPYYAAHWAKFQEQSFAEADMFAQLYKRKVLECLRSTMTRMLPSAYGS